MPAYFSFANDCSTIIPIECGLVYSGNTTGSTNDISNYSCSSFDNVAGDDLYSIVAPSSGTMVLHLNKLTGSDMEIGLLTACHEDSCVDRTSFSSSLTLNNLTPGKIYYVVIDGDEIGDEGAYEFWVDCQEPQSSCGTPINIALDGKYYGTTTNGPSSINSYACTSDSTYGKEKIHKITIAQPADLSVTVRNINGIDLDIALLSACNKDSCIAQGDSLINAYNLKAGEYYVIVDGAGGDTSQQGNYELLVTGSPNGQATLGTCGNPIPLVCGVPYSGNTTGMFNFHDEYNCNIFDSDDVGPDAVHSFVAPPTGGVTAILTRPSSSIDMEVAITEGCSSDSCLNKTFTGTGLSVSTSYSGLTPGQTYYIIVDGDLATDFGAYTVQIECFEGDCSEPIPVQCGTSYEGSTETGGQSSFDVYPCLVGDTLDGPEKIHQVTLTQPGTITATVTALGTGTADLDVLLLQGSCNASSCIKWGDNSLTQAGLPAGTYFVVVDGFSLLDAGPYRLDVNCSDGGSTFGTCFNPISITCETPYNGTTFDGQTNFSSYSCGAQQYQGKEKVHEFTISQTSDITASISGLNGEDLSLFLLDACNPTLCNVGGDTTLNALSLPAGTYYLVVDGAGTDTTQQGNYYLELSCNPVGPIQGDCGNPIALTCGATINGSTSNGQTNFGQYNCTLDQHAGPEKIHEFVITDTSDIYASITGLNGEDLDLILLNSCAQNTCDTVSDSVLNVTGLLPGTYYLVVDGHGTDTSNNGNYTLQFNCFTSGQTTGDCSTPLSLVCGIPLNGNTTNASNNFEIYSCNTQTYSGNENIHEIVLNDTTDIDVSLSNLNGEDLNLFLLSSCDTSSCIANADTSLSANNLLPGTYYLVVDGTDTNQFGTYTLNLSCTPSSNPNGCDDLFFSEYIEGNGQDKAIEIYNPSDSTISLSNYTIEFYTNGATVASSTILLNGTLASNQTYVIANPSANNTILALSNQTDPAITHNGNDAIVLRRGIDNVDIIGQIGNDPGTAWVGGTVSTADQVLIRKYNVQKGLNTNPTPFDPSLEWETRALTDYSNLGEHQNACFNCLTGPINNTVNDTVCDNETVVINGNIIDSSGTYIDSSYSNDGCDSITTINLVINPAPTVIVNADQDTIPVGGTVNFNTNGSNANSYSWDFGDGFTSTLNPVSHTFNSNGTFQTVVTGESASGCNVSDTITIVVGNGVGINETNLSSVSIYPNPTTGLITVDLNNEILENGLLTITNLSGQVVIETPIINKISTIDVSGLPNGIYSLTLKDASQIGHFKIIKS